MAQTPNPLLGYGLPQAEPKLYDVLRAWQTKMLISLNVCKPGQIVSYSYPTATVQILGQRVLKNGQTSPYPQLQKVPVVTMQGGGAALEFPISAGDQCLVFFADRNIDAWYQNGGAQAPLDGRLHDISDGFALVGINWSGSSLIPTPSSTEVRLILKDGTTKVGLENGLITIANASGTLLTVLKNLLTALESLTVVVTGDAGVVSPATIAALEVVGEKLSALLY
jgi:hypothetical protein